MRIRFLRAAGLIALAAVIPGAAAQARETGPTVWLVTGEGRGVEGRPAFDSLTLLVDGVPRKIPLRDLLSFHSAEPATGTESERIARGLEMVRGKDRAAADMAAEDLAEIGLPVLSPLLALYRDTDAHEPDPLYRLFGRIVPGFADAADRKLDLVRLADGSALRGKLAPGELKVTGADGKVAAFAPGTVRRLTVRRSSVERSFDLHALRHCTYIGWLDSGVATTPTSRLRADSTGFVRLSFDEDGWACDPDGIKDPLPGKRRLQEGFRWGAVLARTGAGGERWLVGKHLEKSGLAGGRLYFVVNDNAHWQNNIGSFRVRVRVTDAYDLGEPQ